jgi:hypothetical protein
MWQVKSHFFQKKVKKSKFPNSVVNEKKNNFGKSSATKFLYPFRESMIKKSAKSEMVTGRLVDSYQKNRS